MVSRKDMDLRTLFTTFTGACIESVTPSLSLIEDFAFRDRSRELYLAVQRYVFINPVRSKPFKRKDGRRVYKFDATTIDHAFLFICLFVGITNERSPFRTIITIDLFIYLFIRIRAREYMHLQRQINLGSR